MPQISLSGYRYSYRLVKRFQSSLRLRLIGKRSFIISCPHLTPQIAITRFINQHASWIINHSHKLPPKSSLVSRQTIQILGVPYKISITKTARDSVIIDDKEHIVYSNTTSLSSPHLATLYNHKFRPLALRLITSELTIFKTQFGFDYQKVSVKNQSSRFGSCSSKGNLSFNWQIIFFSPALFRHILLHELTHTLHPNHSKSFWHQFSLYDPNYKSHRLWLKTHGSSLFLIHKS